MPLPSILDRRASARLTDAILSLQPTAYWPLDDGSGPLRDISGRGWNATVTGTPAYGVAAPDPIGRGVTFSGTGQYAATSGSVPNATTAITVGCLMRTTDMLASGTYLLVRRLASQGAWQLTIDGTNKRGLFNLLQSTTTSHCLTFCAASGVLNDGAWHLVIGTFDGTTAFGYTDNLEGQSSAALTGSWGTTSTAGIGIASNSNGSITPRFPGTIAHPFVINRAISNADRLWLHSVAFGG